VKQQFITITRNRGRGDRFLSLKGELEGGTLDQGKRLEMANLDCVRLGFFCPLKG
jgi:hypothetical protein